MKTLACAQHGTSTWRETVMCSNCGAPYKFVPARSGNPSTSDLLDRHDQVRDEKTCAHCGAAFPDALVAICGSCHAAKVAGAEA